MEASEMSARLGKSNGGGEGCAFRRLAGMEELELTLWPTEREAAADRTAELRGGGGPAGGEGGPGGARGSARWGGGEGRVGEPVRAAIRRANAERIGPRMASPPGGVRALDLWQ